MEILRYFLLFVEVVSCVLLVILILMQKSKGGGMGMAFGAGVGESLFGAQTGTVLVKTTGVLAVIFLLNTTILSLIGASHKSSGKSIVDRIPVTKPVQSQRSPAAGAGAEVPAAGIPSGAMPAQMPAPVAQPGVDQPAMPLPAAPAATPAAEGASQKQPSKDK